MTADEPVPYPLPKRLTDKLVPLAILILSSPLLLVVAAATAVDMLLCPADRGPWLYRERRISRGREIGVLKFRVLRADVLARMREEGEEHVRPYEARAENLTLAGRLLVKRFYLDEVPQLVNILRGDMSLVGPRPWPLTMVTEQVGRGVRYRNLVLAGWTGPAQLQKHATTLLESERLDLEYVAACRSNSSWRQWRLDLGILYRTLRLMVRGQGLND